MEEDNVTQSPSLEELQKEKERIQEQIKKHEEREKAVQRQAARESQVPEKEPFNASHYIVDKALLAELAAYLSYRPYREVATLLTRLQRLQAFSPQKADLGPPNNHLEQAQRIRPGRVK